MNITKCYKQCSIQTYSIDFYEKYVFSKRFRFCLRLSANDYYRLQYLCLVIRFVCIEHILCVSFLCVSVRFVSDFSVYNVVFYDAAVWFSSFGTKCYNNWNLSKCLLFSYVFIEDNFFANKKILSNITEEIDRRNSFMKTCS